MEIYLINICIGIVIFLFLVYGSIISVLEKEIRASFRMLFTSFIAASPYIIIGFFLPLDQTLNIILLVCTLILFIILFFPINFQKKTLNQKPSSRIDERDIMFSRRLLKNGTKRYDEYYERNPKNKKKDEKFRSKPGLLSSDSTYFNPVQFAASKASFFTVDQMKEAVDGEVSSQKHSFKTAEITRFLKQWAKKLGALEVGFTELKDYHLYTYGGKDFNYDEPIINKHKFCIAFTVEMDKEMMSTAPAGPTVMESAQQYLNSGAIAVQVASLIRQLGYPAKAHIDGKYDVVCPLVAKDAGLGELGRMGILITPDLGPRVRISVVTTDLPLVINPTYDDHSIIDFCRLCKKCAHVCPSKAISFDNMKEINGIKRWQIDSEHCFTYWCISGTDCGRCMTVCPYSHPNNLFHNFIRFGIKHFPVFRRFAVYMDDFFYGKKPHAAAVPDWLSPGEK